MAEEENYEIQVGNRKGLVVISFVKAIEWVVLPTKEAKELADLILKNAKEAEAEAEAERTSKG